MFVPLFTELLLSGNLAITVAVSGGVSPPAEQALSDTNINTLFGNDGRIVFKLRNPTASPESVNVRIPTAFDGVQFVRVLTVPGESTLVFGRFDPSVYGPNLELITSASNLLISAWRI